ncbi:hypothetical protein [Tahibacter amnicola]|uniref:Dolichyl-phosphate-mannose-protein mannosyltransferase n=1 Tax=Tahibacter amnicola TaxID=2976241 RepID=A0ABY6BFS0_9GAMM|nr:hypothetical protein [Tahibacter amnicola]UXI68714.1 hypothetical protein N4264_03415 [Tahibacter amnicola]
MSLHRRTRPTLLPEPHRRHAPSQRLGWLVVAVWLVAAVRGLLMLSAQPLIAMANNYDQVRYSACLGIFPLRPGEDPTAITYQAPLETFAFQEVHGAPCYLSSDHLFQGAAVGLFHAMSGFGHDNAYSVRWLGGLRWLAWVLVVAAISRALWRERRPALALANALWLAALGFDPVNSVYLNTFYAEAGAVFFAYLVVALCTLTAVRPSLLRCAALALAAVLLALSKMQHLALPLFLAGALALCALRQRPLWPAAIALLIGGSAGLLLQWQQSQRNTALFEGIATVNNANLVLSALLPASSSPEVAAERLGLPPACAAYAGYTVYRLTVPAETACPGIGDFRRTRMLALLQTEPVTLARVVAAVPPQLLPWQPRYLGMVAGRDMAKVPGKFHSIDRPLAARPWLVWPLLLVAPLAWLGLLLGRNVAPSALAFAALCATVAISVPVVSVFGDGISELAKHAHLALNASCAFVLCALFARPWPRKKSGTGFRDARALR